MQKHEDLKAARLLVKRSQAEAALLIGTSRVSYNAWETGKVPIPEGKYEAFLAAVGKTQTDVEAYWASRPAEEKPKPLPAQAEVDAYLLALPYKDAEAYCADILARHKEINRPPRVYDAKGYDEEGYDRNGFDVDGFGRDGYDKKGRDKDGYARPEGASKLRYDKNGYPHPFNRNSIEEAGEAAHSKVWDAHESGDVYAKTTDKANKARSAAEDAAWAKLVKLEGRDFVAREYHRNWLLGGPENSDGSYWEGLKPMRDAHLAAFKAKNEDAYILRLQVEHKLPGFKEAEQRLRDIDAELC